MGVDLFPAVNFPVVLVSIPYSGASPEVVESLVTKPVEDAVSGMADLDKVTSFSSEGLSTVTVQFKDRANADTDCGWSESSFPKALRCRAWLASISEISDRVCCRSSRYVGIAIGNIALRA